MTGNAHPFDLGGKRALVCASTGGLGEAVARGLAAAGATVVVSGRRAERARAIAAELPGAVALECDLESPDAAQSLVHDAEAAVGSIDILVLNGPGPAPATAATVTVDKLRAALDSLFLVQQELISQALPGMRSRGWGRIIAIGSSSVDAPIPGLVPSTAARWALAAYLKTLAGEVAADGVTVNLVLPGRIATDRVAALDRHRAEAQGVTVDDVQRASYATIPAGRYGRPDEFAAPVVFLSSPAASYVTGVALRCDGGLVPVL